MVKDLARDRSRVTMKQAIHLFRGTSVKFTNDVNLSTISGRGVGKEYELGDAERLFELLLIDQAFEEEYVANGGGFSNAYLKVCPSSLLSLARFWLWTDGPAASP